MGAGCLSPRTERLLPHLTGRRPVQTMHEDTRALTGERGRGRTNDTDGTAARDPFLAGTETKSRRREPLRPPAGALPTTKNRDARMTTPPPHPHGSSVDYSFCPHCGATLSQRQLKNGEPARLVCSSCDFVFFLDPKVAAGCIIEDDGGIVLLRRSIEPGYGKWVFPGGYVDRGERVEDAAVRETLEECCLQARIRSLLGVYSYPGRPIVVVVYIADVVGGVLEAADEALEARRFTPDQIPWGDLAFTSTYDALADFLQQVHGLLPPPGSRRPMPF